jgi:Ser/Thr protein kinase RdoA (MazF antagonist)
MTASLKSHGPQSHGLDGTLVAPDWPQLTLGELCTLFAQFPALGPPFRIASVSPRPFSAAGVVVTENGPVFIKRHHVSVRDREGLLEEHRFLAHLHSRGAAVPRVLVSASGETAVTIADSNYEVHEIPSGIDLYQDAISWTPFFSVAHARSAGESLARLHLAAQDFSAPPRQPRPLVASFSIFASPDPSSDPSAAMRRYFTARPALASHPPSRACADQALDLLAPFHSELGPLLPELPPLWTHNDLHASNLFWSDATSSAHATAVIDFGLADRTNAVHDIAHAIERNIVEWLVLVNDPAHPEAVPIHFDHLHALLDGYESVRPLSPAERAALAPMAALCHAEFALSEADYFLGVLHSPEKAAMAYDGWLVGHARWFRGPGRKLVDAIRQWANTRKVVPERTATR